jgi:hypothetical protein
MILRFEIEFDYNDLMNIFSIFKNLTSAHDDSSIIDEKIRNDLKLSRIVMMSASASRLTSSFISFSLELVSKSDDDLRRIHHLSHSRDLFVNSNIADKSEELVYTRLKEILQLILSARREVIILKRDIKNAFRIVLVASHLH